MIIQLSTLSVKLLGGEGWGWASQFCYDDFGLGNKLKTYLSGHWLVIVFIAGQGNMFILPDVQGSQSNDMSSENTGQGTVSTTQDDEVPFDDETFGSNEDVSKLTRSKFIQYLYYELANFNLNRIRGNGVSFSNPNLI